MIESGTCLNTIPIYSVGCKSGCVITNAHCCAVWMQFLSSAAGYSLLSLSNLICLVTVNCLHLTCAAVLLSALSSLSVPPASIPLSSRLGREEECLLALANQICRSYWLFSNQWVQQGKHGEAAEFRSHTPSCLALTSPTRLISAAIDRPFSGQQPHSRVTLLLVA